MHIVHTTCIQYTYNKCTCIHIYNRCRYGTVSRVAGPPQWYRFPRPAPRLPIHTLFTALRSLNSCVLQTLYQTPLCTIYLCNLHYILHMLNYVLSITFIAYIVSFFIYIYIYIVYTICSVGSLHTSLFLFAVFIFDIVHIVNILHSLHLNATYTL